MTTVNIAEMNWVEYDRRVREGAPVLFLTVGALEQHGPHLPMHCDEVIPRRIAEEVARGIGGLVAPSILYGYKSQPRSGGGNHFPGTTSLDGATVVATIRDLLREFTRHGIRRIVVMDGHYENTMFITEGIDLALRDLRAAGLDDLTVLRGGYYEFTSKEAERRVWPDGFPSWPLEHAGVMETSIMLHLHPELVNMDRVPLHGPAAFPPYDIFPATRDTLRGLPESGALISARDATAEKGRLLFTEYVAGIRDALVELFEIDAKALASIARGAGGAPT
jgi:creatinine amidohydrolase